MKIYADDLMSCTAEIDGKWVVARPIIYVGLKDRLRAAWWVISGRALAVFFYGQQDK